MGWEDRAERERGRERPWDRDTKGGLMGGTAAMGVQEWTGPAVFTDAALSCVAFHLSLFFLLLLSHPANEVY